MKSLTAEIHGAGEEARDLLGVLRADAVAAWGMRILIGFTIGAIVLNWAALIGEQLGIIQNEALVDFFRLDIDRALPEIISFMQALLAAALLFALSVRSRRPLLAWLALVFAAVASDDILSYHEVAGEALVAALDLPALPGLRKIDSGELLAWALLGIPLAALLAHGFATSEAKARSLAYLFLATLLLLAVFAVGVDMVHIALTSDAVGLPAALADVLGITPDLATKGMHFVLMTVEDGCEMLAITLAATLALLAWRRERCEATLEARGSRAQAAQRV